MYAYIAVREISYFPNTIFFRQHKWITKLCLNSTTTKVLYLQLWIFGLLLVLQDSWSLGLLVLEWNGLAGCWDGSVLMDVWGFVFRVTVYFCVSGIFGESMRYLHSYGPEVKRWLVCRERSYARIDRANFWGDVKWCLWKTCWMHPIHIQLGFLVRNP